MIPRGPRPAIPRGAARGNTGNGNNRELSGTGTTGNADRDGGSGNPTGVPADRAAPRSLSTFIGSTRLERWQHRRDPLGTPLTPADDFREDGSEANRVPASTTR